MKCFYLLVLLMSVFTAGASVEVGQLKGKVIADGKPLENATVQLLKTSMGTITDSGGNFIIQDVPVGKYQLRVSYIGYRDQRVTVVVLPSVPTNVAITMEPLTNQMQELLVTGTHGDISQAESVTPIDVYGAKYLQHNPTTNLFDAVAGMNGIYSDMDRGISNTTDININGLEGNFTMFLIDGVPAMNGLAGLYALTAFPAGIIDRLEVIKGASSSLYGSDAIAGVINIITKDPNTAPKLVVNASINSMLDANADITASFKIKKATSLLSISGESSNYRWDINHDGFIDVPLVNRGNIFNKWSISRKDNKVTEFYGRYLFEDRFAGQADAPGKPIGGNKYYTEWIRTHQWQGGLKYQLPTKENLLLQADYSEHYQEATYGTSHYNGTQRTGFAQLAWNKHIGKHQLLAGATYRLRYYKDNTGISEAGQTGLNALTHIAGLFVEDEVTLAPNKKLLFGVRFDYNTMTGPVATPRINYKWNTKDGINIVRIGLGTAYRVPNLLNEGFGAFNGSRLVSVPEKLRTEYAVTFNLNYTRTVKSAVGLMTFDGGIFNTYMLNFIEPDYDTDSSKIIYRNSQGGGSVGANFDANIAFRFPLKINIGFTYAFTYELDKDPDGEVEAEQTTHAPPFIANFLASYNFAKPGISIDVTGNIYSPMLLATVPNDFRPDHSPWFGILNIQVTKKFKKGVEIYAGIKNILNVIQSNPILRPFDPFNRKVGIDNPNNYRFDTNYAYTATEGIKGFVGIRYVLR